MGPAGWFGAGAAPLVAGLLMVRGPSGGSGTPGPTDYRSTVVGVIPHTDAVDLSVVGGDAYLRLRVKDGHEVIVPGYNGEPYLRFEGSGVVEENVRSPAVYMNTNRYAQVDIPERADPNAEPRWRQVAGGGVYAWHDHRIHWMSTAPPDGIGRGSEVDRWQIALHVDGSMVTMRGVLRYERQPLWWPWIVPVLAAGALAWAAARRYPRRIVVPVAAGTGCLAALVVAGVEQLSIPAEVGRSLVSVAVPAVGLAAALAALAVTGRSTSSRRRRAGEVLGIAAIGAASGWATVRLAVFTHPVLPTHLAPDLDRSGTALALGLALGAAALIVARPAQQPARRPETPAPGEEPADPLAAAS
jgi:hypothetical protein